MTKLSGEQIEQLQNAILGAFEADELREFLLTRLDKYLSHISLGPNLKIVVFDVITQAEREGWTEALIDAFAKARPQRSDIKELCGTLRAVVQSTEPQIAAPPPTSLSPAERASLERQLAAQRENLLLIEERLAEFVSPSDPTNLQLVKSKRQTEARIAELEAKLS